MAGLKATEADVVLGKRLAEARKAASLVQRELAAAIGVSAAQWQKYEKGTNRIAATSLAIVAELTGKPIGWFFGEEPRRDPGLDADEFAQVERTLLATISDIAQARLADLSGAA